MAFAHCADLKILISYGNHSILGFEPGPWFGPSVASLFSSVPHNLFRWLGRKDPVEGARRFSRACRGMPGQQAGAVVAGLSFPEESPSVPGYASTP